MNVLKKINLCDVIYKYIFYTVNLLYLICIFIKKIAHIIVKYYFVIMSFVVLIYCCI